jgi:catechol 2,3-dioxygenase-like lactoylglutathione lyase family enzyme
VVTLSFISLVVPDPVRSSTFYEELFQLPVVEELTSDWFRGLRLGPTVLGFSHPHAYELLKLPEPDPADGGVRTFFTVEADSEAEVDRLTEAASAAGARLASAPSRTYYGAWQSVLHDLDGHAFRINHLPRGG